MRNAAGGCTFVGSYPKEMPVIGLPEVAFAGRSNVGKSSCLNTLTNAGIARVSRTPGRTQMINLFNLGGTVVFADLPGYGYAKVPAAIKADWDGMMAHYFETRADLRLVVVLVDSRLEPQKLDLAMVDSLRQFRIPPLVVATKVDKLSKNERFKNLAILRKAFALPASHPVAFSSLNGEGKDVVWDIIELAASSPARVL